MKIGEAAEKTGLSVSNIRFYEKKGLLEPKRDQQSKYREYAQEDVERLKLIILYRKMDFSVEKIQLLFQGEVTREEALEQQLLLLKEKQEQDQMLQQAVMGGGLNGTMPDMQNGSVPETIYGNGSGNYYNPDMQESVM